MKLIIAILALSAVSFAQINNPSGGGTGTVTSVLGTTNQITSDGNTTTPTLSLSSTIALPGTLSSATAGASSVSPFTLTGANFVGTGTTSTPLFYINQGTAPTTWSTGTGGTLLGMNAVTGFGGNFLDLHLNGGTSLFSVASSGTASSSGSFVSGSASGFQMGSRSKINSSADGILNVTNNGGTGLTRLTLGLTTSSGPAWCINGVITSSCLGDGTAGSLFLPGGSTVRVASNFTTAANTNLQTITGLTWSLPATGTITASFECDLSYSQGTGSAAVAFGIQTATAAATNVYATGIEQITVGPPATFVTGTLATLASTTATNIVSGTPTATATNYTVHLAGTIENAATTANVINIMVSTATSADAVTVLRGSECTLK